MKNVIASFLAHKDLYTLSFTFGALITGLTQFFVQYTPKEIFGISISLWLLAFGINLIDIHTGIKADTKRKRDLGLKFKFESNKAWRAFEKIFIFTFIMAFVYNVERECVRLSLPETISTIFLAIKLSCFFYVILIEIQSIGENEEVRFGKKSKIFNLLDTLIEVVNSSLAERIRKLISGDSSNNDNNFNEPIN